MVNTGCHIEVLWHCSKKSKGDKQSRARPGGEERPQAIGAELARSIQGNGCEKGGLDMKLISIVVAAAVAAFCPSPSLSFVVANTAGRRPRSNPSSRLSSLFFGHGQIPEIDDVYQLSGGNVGDEYLVRRVSDTFRGGDDSRELEKLSRLSVTELRGLLDQNGIDYRDCLEKRDLVDRLIENRDRTGHHYGDKIDSGLSPEENRVVDTFKRASPSVAFISVGQVQTVQRGFTTSQQDVPMGTGSGFLVGRSLLRLDFCRSSLFSSLPVGQVRERCNELPCHSFGSQDARPKDKGETARHAPASGNHRGIRARKGSRGTSGFVSSAS